MKKSMSAIQIVYCQVMQDVFEILQKSWDLRRQNSIYNHEAFLHLEEAKRLLSVKKNN